MSARPPNLSSLNMPIHRISPFSASITSAIKRRASAICAGWLGWALLLGACAGETRRDEVVRLLEQAATLHREAEVLEARGDVGAARARLEAVGALPFPAWAAEAEDVAVDARTEEAALLLRAQNAAGAEHAARLALQRSTRDSYFRGLAYLRLGDALRALGRPRDAADAFERSIAVNRATMERLAHQESK